MSTNSTVPDAIIEDVTSLENARRHGLIDLKQIADALWRKYRAHPLSEEEVGEILRGSHCPADIGVGAKVARMLGVTIHEMRKASSERILKA